MDKAVIDGEIFPGGSKQRVTNAGIAVRNGSATKEDGEVIDARRAARRHVLNTFQAILRTKTEGTNVVLAQRHKRRSTIFGKRERYSSMQLARMDDVAGCRLIFPTIEDLYLFRKDLHLSRFKRLCCRIRPLGAQKPFGFFLTRQPV